MDATGHYKQASLKDVIEELIRVGIVSSVATNDNDGSFVITAAGGGLLYSYARGLNDGSGVTDASPLVVLPGLFVPDRS